MENIWLALALIVPVQFAVLNIMDKVLRDKHFSSITLNVVAGVFGLLGLAGFFFIEYDLPPAAAGIALLAGALWFLGGFPYYKALSLEEVSRVVPLWQLQSPLALVAAWLLLGERLTSAHYVSFLLIVLGAFLISAKSVQAVLKPRPVFILMLLASALLAGMSLIAKYLYADYDAHSVQLTLLIGTAVPALAALLPRKIWHVVAAEIRAGTSALPLLVVRQLLAISVFLTLSAAISRGSVSLTIALSGLASFFVLVFATLLSVYRPALLQELADRKTLLTKALAIALIVSGLFVLAR